MKKRILALLMVSVMVFGMVGTTVQAEESDDDVIAYFIGLMQGGAAWGAAEEGFNAACEELGWEGYYVAPTTANDLSELVTLAETALTNGATVLLGCFVEPEVYGDILTDAYNDGVVIAGTNAYIDDPSMAFWIGTDPAGMGLTQAETLVDVVGDGEATVVYMQTQLTSTTQNMQFEAFSEYLEDYDNITVWGQEECNSDEVAAAETISNLVKANPEINAVVCADGNGCIGLANYVDETGCADSFYAVGIDDYAEVINYILSGVLDCSIAQDFYAMGYEGIYMCKQVVDGEEVPFDNDSGSIVITAENAESYAEEKGIELN